MDEIEAVLTQARDQGWLDLWDALDALAHETTFATWAGGEVVETTIVDGEARPVRQMPYPVYSESVERVLRGLRVLKLSVPFDWMRWDGMRRYDENPAALADAEVGDAVRVLTAIQRAERFGDGTIEAALKSGLMQAALARLRRWHDDRAIDQDRWPLAVEPHLMTNRWHHRP